MKSAGPKLPKGSMVGRWNSIEIHPPSEKDINGCNSCNNLAPTWWIQFPGLSVRLCDECFKNLAGLMGAHTLRGKHMRDPKRINKVLELLRTYWLSHPDLRLGQIVSNASGIRQLDDPFYMEDDQLERWLRRQLRQEK